MITWNYLVSTNEEGTEREETASPQRDYKNADYVKMTTLLQEVEWKALFESKSVDECTEIFYNKIEDITNECIPWKSPGKWFDRPPWMSKAARKMIRKKEVCMAKVSKIKYLSGLFTICEAT